MIPVSPTAGPAGDAPSSVAPPWLRGAWSRPLLRTPAGDDTTTRVRYVQAGAHFGDVRVPASRDGVPRRPLSALDPRWLRLLAGQQGFAGTAMADGAEVTWHRDIDYQPPSATADVGRMSRVADDALVEHGVHAAYLEHWTRLPRGGGATLACRTDEPPCAVLAIAGDHFAYARDRRRPLPSGVATLREALGAGTRDDVLAWLDCELSWGRIASDWTIGLSTLPAREGTALFLPGNLRRVADDTLDEHGPDGVRRWRMTDGDADALLARVAGRQAR